jgi:hypothetical protein
VESGQTSYVSQTRQRPNITLELQADQPTELAWQAVRKDYFKTFELPT